jgi:hypothetical protein
MPKHNKWRVSDSPDYSPLLDNFAARDFLVSSRPSVSFIRAFNSFFINNLNSFRIFSQSDLFFLWHNRLQRSKGFKASINTVYKRKVDKVRPVDSDKSNGSTPGNNKDWKQKVKERFGIPEGLFKKYDYLLIPKFSVISRKTRLTPERFAEIKIGKKLLKAKKDLLTEMLYNRKTALA